jgi:hypothetical protein
MGTLFNQPERRRLTIMREDVENFLEMVADLAKKHRVDVAVALDAWKVCEMKRATDLHVDNRNVLDEQLAGFGEILRDIGSKLRTDSDD